MLAGMGAGIDDPATRIQDRPLGLLQRLDRQRDQIDVPLGLRRVMRPPWPPLGIVIAGCELHVLGDVDQNRAGAAAGGDVKRLVDRLAQTVGILDQPVVLGAGPGNADRIGLLKRVVADHEGRNLARKNNQRDRIHQRVRHAGDRIGRPGPRGHQNNAGLAGRPRVSFGRMGRALLVPDQDVPDIVLLKDLVINR